MRFSKLLLSGLIAFVVLVCSQGIAGAQTVSFDRIDFDSGTGGVQDWAMGNSLRPTGVVTADFDADGYVDFATISITNSSTDTVASIRIADCSGYPCTFDDVETDKTVTTSSSNTAALAVGNLAGGDSLPDIVAFESTGDDLYLIENTGSGTFATPVKIAENPLNAPQFVTVEDLNSDDADDIIIVSKTGSSRVVILLQCTAANTPLSGCPSSPDGDFVESHDTTNTDVYITVAEVDGTSGVDMLGLNRGTSLGPIYLFSGNDDGTFDTPAQLSGVANARWFTAADLDGDDDIDIALVDNDDVRIYLGNGSGSFSAHATTPTIAIADHGQFITNFDFDGDDDLDLAVKVQNESVLRIYRNDGSAGYTLYTSPSIDSNTEWIAAGNLMHDGTSDLITANNASNTVTIIRSVSVPSDVTLVDASSSCSGAACDGTTWATAFKTVQEGVDEASGSSGAIDEVWVAGGTYVASSSNAAVVTMADGIAIYGGFKGESGTPAEWLRSQRVLGSEESILDGDRTNNGVTSDDSYHVVIGDNNAVMDGFTITGGNAAGTGDNANGGGIFNDSNSGLVVSNCRITANTADVDGGGIYNFHNVNGNGSLTLVNLMIDNNDANIGNNGDQGGGLWSRKSNFTTGSFTTTITDSHFSDNSASAGGGIYAQNIIMDVINSSFDGNSTNSGGAVFFLGDSTIQITNSSFRNNTGTSTGGAIFHGDTGSTATIQNAAFFGNSSTNGNKDIDLDVGASTPTISNTCSEQNFTSDFSATSSVTLTSTPFTTSDLIGEGNAGLENTDGISEVYLLQSSNNCLDLGSDADATSAGIDWTNLTTSTSGTLDADSGDGVSTGTDVDAGRHYEPAP